MLDLAKYLNLAYSMKTYSLQTTFIRKILLLGSLLLSRLKIPSRARLFSATPFHVAGTPAPCALGPSPTADPATLHRSHGKQAGAGPALSLQMEGGMRSLNVAAAAADQSACGTCTSPFLHKLLSGRVGVQPSPPGPQSVVSDLQGS